MRRSRALIAVLAAFFGLAQLAGAQTGILQPMESAACSENAPEWACTDSEESGCRSFAPSVPGECPELDAGGFCADSFQERMKEAGALYSAMEDDLFFASQTGRSRKVREPPQHQRIAQSSHEDKECVESGGSVSQASCCLSAEDFPNLCLMGPCGCSSENSHTIKICDCGEGKCFDGVRCVDIP
jgi:hypothetical protein